MAGLTHGKGTCLPPSTPQDTPNPPVRSSRPQKEALAQALGSPMQTQ